MLCAEWWSFELMTILAGILGVYEQATIVISFNVIAQVFMVPCGMAEASCTFIGNSIGANNPKLARKYNKIIFTIWAILQILIALSLAFFRMQIASLFTSD